MAFKELSQTYNPKEIEEEIYLWWEKEGFFRPEKQRELGLVKPGSPKFCITIPPPNVTGQLHLGHAITIAIEDYMTRYERLRGKETLFVPGCDHAGIATQNVVERELLKQGIKRKELGREKFVEKVWEWKKKYHARITEQSKRLGISCDWTRERFTLDENLSRAVRVAFVTLYKKGLIYRGKYLVNWCPGRCESAISDLEAIPEDEESFLWYLKYPVITKQFKKPAGEWGSGSWAKGATEFIEVATTRPETLLGDAGVATHEKHEKYGKLIGKKAILPAIGREIPIFNDQLVDPAFGTGAVKVTPAHDPADYEMGQRHGLEFITVMDEKGNMVKGLTGKYGGIDRFKCRQDIVADLKKEGLLIKIEPYTHAVAHCQRCDAVVEPRISTQWFVSTKTLAGAAMDAVRSGLSKIIPEREERRFFQWMEHIKDWCISRQLWWGHRIPVWYCANGHQVCELEDPVKCPECGDTNLKQDEDVLDTWFSSGLWPFSTLGWPNEEDPDFQRFYPTDMRETGYDILFFWVAREMMLGCEFTKRPPYSFIYLHGIVRNEESKKISKSMENVERYDPLNIIKDSGCDALRHTLVSNAVPGMDVNMDFRQLEASKRFCNKIWQSTKYVLGNIQKGENIPRIDKKYPAKKFQLADKWILSRLNRLIKNITEFNEQHDYMNASRELKNFIWDEFCDWYIEASKVRLYSETETDKVTPKAVLLHVLESCLIMMHPIMPHLTEALWQALPASIKTGPAIIVAKWPEFTKALVNDDVESGFGLAMDLVKGIRSIRTDFNVPPGTKIPLTIDAGENKGIIDGVKGEIEALARIDPIQMNVLASVVPPKHAGRLLLRGITAYLPLEGLIDLEKEKTRISNEMAKVEKLADQCKKKLASPFAQKADAQVVQQEREKLAGYEEKLTRLKEQMEILG
nr:valine--tRNA ligase [Candidatus Sigynarchaeota archaeon]